MIIEQTGLMLPEGPLGGRLVDILLGSVTDKPHPTLHSIVDSCDAGVVADPEFVMNRFVRPGSPCLVPGNRGIALRNVQTLDTPDRFEVLVPALEERYDRIARLAASVFGCPYASIMFADDQNLWHKAAVGITPTVIPRTRSICNFTLESEQVLVIPDTHLDSRLQNHPAVSKEPGIRFYAGQAILAADGCRIGTLCVWDEKARDIDPEQLDRLDDLVRQVEAELKRIDSDEARILLDESEQKFLALSEPNTDAVCTIHPDGSLIALNEAGTRLTGYSMTDLLGFPFIDLIAKDHLQPVESGFRRCLAGKPQHLAAMIQHKEGAQVPVSIFVSPYFVSGELRGVVGVMRNVSERVAVNQELKLALENSSQRMWVWDIPEGEINLSGPLVGSLNPNENISVDVFMDTDHSPVHERDLPQVVEQMQQLLRGHSDAIETEYRSCRDDGDYYWALARGKVTERDRNGKPCRVLGTLMDIHERKLEEQMRLQEAERMELAMQAGGIGLFEMDMDRGQLRRDTRLFKLFGLRPDASDPTYERISLILHPDDRERFHAEIQWLDGSGSGNEIETEHRVIWPDGSIHHLRFLGKVLTATEGAPRLLTGMCWEVTESRELQRKLSYHATHDALTGLLNRFEFKHRIQEMQQSARENKKEHAVCFIDLDRFQLINDTAGHGAGDALLRELGVFLAQRIRASDVLARLGGDEFGLLLPDCSLSQAGQITQKLINELELFSFRWESQVYNIGASIGIAQLTKESLSPDIVMSQADIACFAAKHAGRNRTSIYQSEQDDAGIHHQQLRIAAGIRQALDEDRFCLYAQPIIATGARVKAHAHFELLVRMQHNGSQLISPASFIPAAEHYDLMHLVDRWVLREALVHRGAELASCPELIVSLNISANSLNDPTFPAFIQTLIAQSPLAPEQIHFEITETAAVTNFEPAVEIIRQLRRCGCAIALDDFGIGLSSFSYLKHFPVDFVKIDGSFIRKLKESDIDRAIVEAIHAIACRIGAQTIAEFVEDYELLKLVREIGIDYAQGFGIGSPEPLEQVLKALQSEKSN